jgi:hypothetical protein
MTRILRRPQPIRAAYLDPLYRLSPNFILGDFLGNQSVYTKGLPNGLDEDDPELTKKLANGGVLCRRILEPILDAFGPISISYGFIAPELSDRIVTYQDSRKPSHHLWNLGAAADICVHQWVEGCEGEDVTANSPAALAALLIEDDGASYPLSRLITYSESPYICVAAAADEVRQYRPRMAIYENRYTGRPKIKPDFRSYNSTRARADFRQELRDPDALARYGWRGAGYPTHHGGGMQQYHHRRVSKYTMVSDWIVDLQSIANGMRRIPKLNDPQFLDAIAAAGIVYDAMLDTSGAKRLSLVKGYNNDWIGDEISFDFILPQTITLAAFRTSIVHLEQCGLEIEKEHGTETLTARLSIERIFDQCVD